MAVQEIEHLLTHPSTAVLLDVCNILLTSRIPDALQPCLKPHLERTVVQLVASPDLGLAGKAELADNLVSAMPALVSASVETCVLGCLLSCGGLSSRTLKCFVTFTNNRPSLAARQLPLLTAGLRQHLEAMVEQQEGEDSLALCNQVQQLAGLAKRRKEDWGNVAPYLVADILSTNLQLNNHNLKQALVTATHSFLDLCETHSHEYLAANLPPAVNEMFKIVLQNYKANFKFSGRHT